MTSQKINGPHLLNLLKHFLILQVGRHFYTTLPRHKDYAPSRKVDIKASNSKVQKKFAEYVDYGTARFQPSKESTMPKQTPQSRTLLLGGSPAA